MDFIVTAQGRKVFLPGRSVNELIGELVRVESRPHKCTSTLNCPHDSHQRRNDVYIHDGRPGSPWESHHEGSTWVAFYSPAPHPDVLEVWRQVVGPNVGEYRIAMLQVIRRSDGDLLIASALNGIFDCWFSLEQVGEPK